LEWRKKFLDAETAKGVLAIYMGLKQEEDKSDKQRKNIETKQRFKQ